MSDTQSDLERSQAIQFEMMARAFADPKLAAERSSPAPQQMYFDLAAKCPVREIGDQMYSLMRMEDILFVTKHPDVEQASKYLGSDRPAIPLGLDGAEHRKYRRLLDPVFTAKRVAPLAPQVEQLANEMIDGFIANREVDAYRAWCEPLPSTVFLSIMGLPMEDLDQFLRFKNLVLGNESLEHLEFDERMARYGEAVSWIHSYFEQELDRRYQADAASDDMIGWLVTTEVEGERLGKEELLDILGLLMIAGLDTVAASLACFLSYFARHPQDRARIKSETDLLRPAVEELMRYESPVIEGFRKVNADLTLPSGAEIKAGSNLHISWSSANLDPDFFDRPLEVDLERAPNRHIGFASGYHRCLGSHLARMEMQTALRVWHQRIPDYEVKPGTDLVYTGNPRAPHHLTLVW